MPPEPLTPAPWQGALDFGAIGVKRRCDRRNRLPLGVAQQNVSTLDLRRRFGSRLRQAIQPRLIRFGENQFGPSTVGKTAASVLS
jgi:hypothetical protein